MVGPHPGGFRSAFIVFGAVVSALALAACGASDTPMGGMFAPSGIFGSNGERIYFTAVSASGHSISYQGGPAGGMMGGMACVTCHGANGQGGHVVVMGRSLDVPGITWPALTTAHHEEGEAEHPPYTEDTVKRAITIGLDPAGHPLDILMPRWSMADADLDDLVGFLKRLR